MRPASQLVEQGIRAYTRGAVQEAERCWREALELEPRNERARSYLDLLTGKAFAMSQPEPPATPVAVPPPTAEPSDGPAGLGPVALPVPRLSPPPPPDELEVGPVTPPRLANPFDADPPPVPPPQDPHPSQGGLMASPWDQGPAENPSIVLDGEGSDGGLDLHTLEEKSDLRPLVPDGGQPVAPAAPPPPSKPVSDVEVWMQGAKELHALGDFSGSLEMIEKILKSDPVHAEARDYLRQNESTLIAMYESKLGSMTSIPRLAIKPEEVLWLNLDHRAGFLLAQVDGAVNYEDLFALSGLPRLDTARILATLLQEGVISS